MSAILPVANQGLQPRFIYSQPAQLSHGRTGGRRRNGRGIEWAAVVACPATPTPSRPPTSLARRRCALFPAAPRSEGGGGAEPAMRPPTRHGVHPCRFLYVHITWRGTRGCGRRKVAVVGCGQFFPTKRIFLVSVSIV